jgi:hypothetical protein
METTTTSPWQVGLKYGMIMGLISAVINAISYATKLFLSMGASFGLLGLSLVVLISVLVFAGREFKSQNEGFMTFGQGFITCLAACLISSFIGAAFAYIWIAYIDTSIPELMKEMTAANLAKFGAPEEEIEKAMAAQDFGAFSSARSAMIAGVVGGTIVSLIMAAIMKKNPPEFV